MTNAVNLRKGGTGDRITDIGVSSIVVTWLLLRDKELNGEQLTSPGMVHSNQIREFLLTVHRIELRDVYLGPSGVLTGSDRQSQEAKESAEAVLRKQQVETRRREVDRKRQALESRIVAIRQDFEAEEEVLKRIISEGESPEEKIREDRPRIAFTRQAETKQPRFRTGK